MTSEAMPHTAEPQQVSVSTEKDIQRIKALIRASDKTLDNHDIAKKRGLDKDYVKKLCFDIMIGTRQNFYDQLRQRLRRN